MGFFDLFKRNRNEDIDFNSDITRLINKGVLFDDERIFLKWNEPLAEVKKRVSVSERLFADRAVCTWGERSILGGLKLPLITVFWYNDPDSDGKLFRSIEFNTEGNGVVEEYFGTIKKHLEEHLKVPVIKEDTDISSYREWIAGDVKLSLHGYEKYSIKKLKFEIIKL